MEVFGVNVWKTIPSLRIVVGLIMGIVSEYYYSLSLTLIYIITALACLMLFLFPYLPLRIQFKTEWIKGILLNITCFAVGCLMAYFANVQHHKDWIGNTYQANDKVWVTLQEPFSVKERTYKAIASIDAINKDHLWHKTSGKVLLYFKKEIDVSRFGYGSQMVLNAKLADITNSGNPGAFDYKRYCLFQGITHQTFINIDQYVWVKNAIPSYFDYYLFKIRDKVIAALQKFLPNPRAYGIGEALLIGYRDDLDRDLVQAYSNTGVVHIIAISGMHLGMLYGTMLLFFKLFKQRKWVAITKPIVILLVLWVFTLIAGAVPSILRSAFMFTFILVSELINKRSSIYNTLSLSALCMMVFNPFCIWDVGFQLSYAAVLSISMFSKYIMGWYYFKNKLLQYIWQLNAVTIAAQVWTFPLIIYYFHQFPKLVLISNLIVVPLSCIILYGEILLLFLGSVMPLWASYFGKIVQASIVSMNWFIEQVASLKYGVWDSIKVNPLQTILLFIFIVYSALWLMYKAKEKLLVALSFLMLFFMVRCYDYIIIKRQHQLMVYNIPKSSYIEIQDGTNSLCYADSGVFNNTFINGFHIKPAQIVNRSEKRTVYPLPNYIIANKKTIVIIKKPIKHTAMDRKIPVDMVIIAQNAKVTYQQIVSVFDCKKIVIDASNNMWKTRQMIKDNNLLNLQIINTQISGAFMEAL